MSGRGLRVAASVSDRRARCAAVRARFLRAAGASRAAAIARRAPRSAGPVDEKRWRVSGTVHRIPRRDEFRGGWRPRRPGGGRGPAAPEYPYTPEAAAERDDRLKRGYEDPEARCHLPGVPRALDQPGGLYPVQIIQDEKSVALLHEAMHDVRIIPTDNSPHPRNYWAWDGDSRGRWEGDTLVVDVSNFNGRTWLDMQANFVDENEHVVERFTLVDRDTIQYEATDHRSNGLRQTDSDALHAETSAGRAADSRIQLSRRRAEPAALHRRRRRQEAEGE